MRCVKTAARSGHSWRGATRAAILAVALGLAGCGAAEFETGNAVDRAAGAPSIDAGAGGSSGGDSSSVDRVPPTAPENLTGLAVSTSQINLSWSTSTDNVGVSGYRVYRGGVFLTTVGANAYQNTGLSAATTYSYTVRAFDEAGNFSAQSPAAIVTTPGGLDTTAPSTPTGLVATAVSTSQINLNWTASTDNVAVAGYRIFQNGALLIEIGNVTSYQSERLSPSTTYIYTVRALDAAGNVSPLSTAVSATTQSLPDVDPPTTPTNLTANTVSPSQVSLSWTASTDNEGVTGYRIFRNSAFLVAPGNVTTFQDTGLTGSTTYTYNVVAVDAAGNASGLSNEATVTTPVAPDTIAPATPTGLTASAVSDSQINLSWSDSTDNVGVTGYRVLRNGTLIATLGNVTTFQNTGLAASTTYSYTVRALDAAGNVSGQSTAASATTMPAPDTVAPTTPTGLTANAISSSRINLNWSASTDNVAVAGYRLYRNGVFLVALGNVTTYQSTGLSASTAYSYIVDAIDAAGNASGISTAAAATTLAPNTATLAWDAVSASSLGGYRVYYGTASGTYFQSAGQGVNVGNVTTFTVTGLGSGTRYFFAVTAFDTLNDESVFSNQVIKDIP